MITTVGKQVIVNYFGGQVPTIGDTLALGTGTTAASVNDTALATEVTRVKVTSISADTANARIIFKAVVPPNAIPLIKEVGLYSTRGLVPQLVARVVLATPVSTNLFLPTEIEYCLAVTA